MKEEAFLAITQLRILAGVLLAQSGAPASELDALHVERHGDTIDSLQFSGGQTMFDGDAPITPPPRSQ
jgi:hypothetical protein